MNQHISNLQEMYPILPGHDNSLTTESVDSIYKLYGIQNYHQFLYTPENIEYVHVSLRNDSQFASRMSNVVKEDIVNEYKTFNEPNIQKFMDRGIIIVGVSILGIVLTATAYTLHNTIDLVHNLST